MSGNSLVIFELAAAKRLIYQAKKASDIARSRRWQANHPDKYREYQRSWRQKNKDRIRECQRSWYQKNKDRVRSQTRAWRNDNKDKTKAQNERGNKKRIANLTDPYIRQLIVKDSALKHGDVPKDLLPIKREQIKALRTIKEMKVKLWQ